MQAPIFLKLKQILTVLLVTVVLLLAVFKGYNSGKANAQSRIILNNAINLATALNYFNNDQERFPSAVEFSAEGSRAVMLNYLNSFPPANISGGSCSQSYKYSRDAVGVFKLDFCLPSGVEGFNQGWNRFDQDSRF